MSKSEPSIQKYMTTQPLSIDAIATVKEAQELMKLRGIRHLPVVKGSTVKGILSDRDIKLVMGFEEVDAAEICVADICQSNPYIVSPNTQLHKVVSEMAEKHYGSAIVVDNNKLVGIFTTVDACKALAEILQTRYHEK